MASNVCNVSVVIPQFSTALIAAVRPTLVTSFL